MSKFFIARDGNGDLFFYAGKPRLAKEQKVWKPAVVRDGGLTTGVRLYQKLNKTLYPEVTFEGSPMEVELKLIQPEKINGIKVGDMVIVHDIEHPHPLQVMRFKKVSGTFYAVLQNPYDAEDHCECIASKLRKI